MNLDVLVDCKSPYGYDLTINDDITNLQKRTIEFSDYGPVKHLSHFKLTQNQFNVTAGKVYINPRTM